MGTRRTKEKEGAIKLRLVGKIYGEIQKTLNIASKGTLSSWLKGVRLTRAARKKLSRNTRLAHERGLYAFNKERTHRIKNENYLAFQDGYAHIGEITQRELLLMGAALYWGEGTKALTRTRNPSLAFANSDPKMVVIFMRFVREILRIPEKKIRAGFHIYKTIRDDQARKYWSKATGLPQDRFYVIRQVSTASKKKRNPRLLPFGTVVIKVNDRKVFHRVLGMIAGLASHSSHHE